jgi:hypothetical protein
MMERYWPTDQLNPQEKLMRTANTVGFQLPEQGSPLSDIERQDLEREAREAEINFEAQQR